MIRTLTTVDDVKKKLKTESFENLTEKQEKKTAEAYAPYEKRSCYSSDATITKLH